jgi:hypothetical protein
MPLRKRDLGFIIVIGGLLLVLILNSFRDKPKNTPADEQHRQFREALARGDKREAVESGCVTCHNAATRPLRPKHPPKEQCLICHPLQQAH